MKATLDEKPCAAKVLHRAFLDSQDPALSNFISRFEQECQILRDLTHPNIVQFLGMVQDPSTNKPILLMELMDESLTDYLKNATEDVPYDMQLSILHDIAQAVAHLHKNGIIHRDLSSNNILLNTSHQAKVTDFGMSKIAASNPSMTHSKVTQCPGTLVYMPPEALRPQPRYSDKIDTFSIGVLLLQIVTRSFPGPTAASVIREDPNSPTNESYIPVPEIDRRKEDIDKVPESHSFYPIIMDCLKDVSKDRPTAEELCQKLEQLKIAAEQPKAEAPTHQCILDDLVSTDLLSKADIEAVLPLAKTEVNVAVAGVKGSGKSTLINALCGAGPQEKEESAALDSEVSTDNEAAQKLQEQELQEVGSDPAAQELQEVGSDPAAQEVKEVGSNPAAQEAQEVGSDPAAQESQEVGSGPAAQEAQEVGSDPAAQESQEVGSDPAAQESQEVGSHPAAQESQEVGSHPAVQESQDAGSDPAAQESQEVGSDPAAQESQEVGSDPAAQESQEVGSDPAAQESQKVGSDPAAQVSQKVGSDPAAQESEEVASYEAQSATLLDRVFTIRVWDSPGLQDKAGQRMSNVEQLNKQCATSDIDLFLYCVNASVTRGVVEDMVPDIKNVTQTLGADIWHHAMVVLTFANVLKQNIEEVSCDAEDTNELFTSRISYCKKKVFSALTQAGIPEEIASRVQIEPAGHYSEPSLPGRPHWLGNLWLQFFSTASDEAKLAILITNQHRIRNAEQLPGSGGGKEIPIILEEGQVDNVSKSLKSGVGVAATSSLSAMAVGVAGKLIAGSLTAKVAAIAVGAGAVTGVGLGIAAGTVVVGPLVAMAVSKMKTKTEKKE